MPQSADGSAKPNPIDVTDLLCDGLLPPIAAAWHYVIQYHIRRRIWLTEPGYITLSGPVGAPAGHFRTALLAVAMTLCILFAALLITIQPTLHKVSIDLIEGLSQEDEPQEPRPVHRLDVDGAGKIFLDNVQCHDLVELRQALDLLMQTLPEPAVEMRADPEARYEDFLRTLAIVKQANVTWLRLDFEPLAEEMGEAMPGLHHAAMARPARRMVPALAALTFSPADPSLDIPEPAGCAAKLWSGRLSA